MELEQLTETLLKLDEQLTLLNQEVSRLRLPGCTEQNWFHLFHEKLLPQIKIKEQFYIAAIVGGTNLGKSSIFNHLAGEVLTATTPLASGTKQPFCLIPEELRSLMLADEMQHLKTLFPGFVHRELVDPQETLQSTASDTLFFRFSQQMPKNLLLLDTPDIDSTDETNWKRAEKIRRTADVLVAVLTQQRYNDISVKHFFREVADEDKVVVLIYNMCQLPSDEEYWPKWTATFIQETGVNPQHFYLIPHNRAAALSGNMAFFARDYPPLTKPASEPVSLMKDLAELKFSEIKLQTMQGALRHLLHEEHGIPQYLKTLSQQTSEYHRAGELLAKNIVTQLANWPKPPQIKYKQALFNWWNIQQQGWSKSVHGFYQSVGETITYPFRFWQGEVKDPWEDYRQQEWKYVVTTLESLYKQLRNLSDLNNPLLKPRLDFLLSGGEMQRIQQQLQQDLQQVEYGKELDQVVSDKLRNFREDAPGYYQMFQILDQFLAIAKPAASISLFVTGFGPVGNVFLPAVTEGITQTLLHVAGGVGVMAVGEPIMGTVANQGFQKLLEIFNQIQQTFIVKRGTWLANELEQRIYGQLVLDLKDAALLTSHETFVSIEQLIQQLRNH